MKCLDTDFLIAVLRGREAAREKMNALDGEGRHCTTAINSFELFYGAHKSKQRRDNLEKARMLLERVEVLPFESESSDEAGSILAELSGRGESIEFRDAMIAGVAVSRGLALVTRNSEHFARVRGLRLEPW